MKHHLAFLVQMESNGYEDLKSEYKKTTVKVVENFVWDCFSHNRVWTLQFIDGTMDKYQYINIQANNITTSSTKIMLNDFFSRIMILSMHQNILRIISEKKTSKYWNGHLNRRIWIRLNTYGRHKKAVAIFSCKEEEPKN